MNIFLHCTNSNLPCWVYLSLHCSFIIATGATPWSSYKDLHIVLISNNILCIFKSFILICLVLTPFITFNQLVSICRCYCRYYPKTSGIQFHFFFLSGSPVELFTTNNELEASCVIQPRSQGFSHFLREKPWGRGCCVILLEISGFLWSPGDLPMVHSRQAGDLCERKGSTQKLSCGVLSRL